MERIKASSFQLNHNYLPHSRAVLIIYLFSIIIRKTGEFQGVLSNVVQATWWGHMRKSWLHAIVILTDATVPLHEQGYHVILTHRNLIKIGLTTKN